MVPKKNIRSFQISICPTKMKRFVNTVRRFLCSKLNAVFSAFFIDKPVIKCPREINMLETWSGENYVIRMYARTYCS